jgi:16S rRNA (guanine527-N7)-methyltransferase
MDLINKYFSNLDKRQYEQFSALLPLYKNWNAKINVVSRKDIDNLYLHHVLHSLAIAKVVQFVDNSNILDVGTGGGFPGLPLAIMFPKANFLLVDSIGKKIKVVDAISSELGLGNVKTAHQRAENIEGQFDFALARAVTRLDNIWAWASSKMKPANQHPISNGLLYLKGGDIDQETPNGVDVKRWELSQFFSEPFFNEKALVLLAKHREN